MGYSSSASSLTSAFATPKKKQAWLYVAVGLWLVLSIILMSIKSTESAGLLLFLGVLGIGIAVLIFNTWTGKTKWNGFGSRGYRYNTQLSNSNGYYGRGLLSSQIFPNILPVQF